MLRRVSLQRDEHEEAHQPPTESGVYFQSGVIALHFHSTSQFISTTLVKQKVTKRVKQKKNWPLLINGQFFFYRLSNFI